MDDYDTTEWTSRAKPAINNLHFSEVTLAEMTKSTIMLDAFVVRGAETVGMLKH